MKNFALIAVVGTALLTGCAANRNAGTPQVATPEPIITETTRQQAVSVPAAAAKKLVLHMSGPKTVTTARDWESFKAEWRATFADHAKEAGIAFATQDGEARPSDDTGTLLTVYVNDYRMVGIGSRIFFGVMTGNAYIDAKVTYNDLKTGKPFGAKNFNTSSSAGQGIFGKMTPQQVDTIATGVFQELKTSRQ